MDSSRSKQNVEATNRSKLVSSRLETTSRSKTPLGSAMLENSQIIDTAFLDESYLNSHPKEGESLLIAEAAM